MTALQAMFPFCELRSERRRPEAFADVDHRHRLAVRKLLSLLLLDFLRVETFALLLLFVGHADVIAQPVGFETPDVQPKACREPAARGPISLER